MRMLSAIVTLSASICLLRGYEYADSHAPTHVTNQELLRVVAQGDLTELHVYEDRHEAWLQVAGNASVNTTSRWYTTTLPTRHRIEEDVRDLGLPEPPPIYYNHASTSQWVWTMLAYALLYVSLLGVVHAGMKRCAAQGTARRVSLVTMAGDGAGTGLTFQDVAGLDEAKLELREYVDFMRHRDAYASIGARLPHGLLLVGDPGCGKTLLAKTLAGECGVNFMSISGSDFNDRYIGVGASRVRALFAEARSLAPCVLFIDEIDSVGHARNTSDHGGSHENDVTLNKLLVEMDGFTPNDDILVVAATNRDDCLDPALLRSGRFDRKIIIDPPNVREREAIFRMYLGKVQVADAAVDDAATVDDAAAVKDAAASTVAKRMARSTPGFSGADIANICNHAAILAVRDGRSAVRAADVEAAVDDVGIGARKRDRLMTERETAIVAHHEAGHAVLGYLLPHAAPPIKVSIVPRGRGVLGFSQPEPQDRKLATRPELLSEIVVLFGGRVAETLVFGCASTGAHDDIRKATGLARRLVTEYGLSGLGPVAMDLSRHSRDAKHVGPATLNQVDAEVRAILDTCHASATRILSAHRAMVDALATRLLGTEELRRAGIVELLGEAAEDSVPVAGDDDQLPVQHHVRDQADNAPDDDDLEERG
jgi:ATP-dependent metalloprotease FtsH